jgi:aspartyl/asparaginyl beta-hydroxylase (cupin superfamily)
MNLKIIIIFSLLLLIRYIIKDKRKENKNKRLFYSSNEIPQLKILDKNWRIIAQECNKLTLLHMKNLYHNKEIFNYDIILDEKLVLDSINLCPITINILKSIPNILYAGYSILKSNSEIYKLSLRNTITYHLGLNISTQDPSYVNIHNLKMSDKTGKSFMFDSTYNYSEINTSVFDNARLVIIFKKSNMISYIQ